MSLSHKFPCIVNDIVNVLKSTLLMQKIKYYEGLKVDAENSDMTNHRRNLFFQESLIQHFDNISISKVEITLVQIDYLSKYLFNMLKMCVKKIIVQYNV